jgi:NAD(P)-dependent dehydrogenase (short-subunit alcohol dehydrogenase family)
LTARANIGRYAVGVATAPPLSGNAGLASEGAVVLVDDGAGVGPALAERLRARGERVVRVVAHAVDASAGDDLWVGDLADLEAGSRVAAALAERGTPAKALVHLAALDPAVGEADDDHAVTSRFQLARALGGDLERAAETGGAAVVGATALGGAFGIAGSGTSPAAHGSIAGFLKSLAQEWPAVRVKAVDLSPADAGATADALLAELFADDGLVEVGYRDGIRTTVELRPGGIGDGAKGDLPLDADSVVLITGGARGITAEVALTLAERARPALVLVGRTPAPEDDEDPRTASLTDPRALRQAILERMRAEGGKVTPPVVEAEYRRLTAARDVRQNLARLRGSGARVEYVACDVRDGDAFGAVIDDVYARHGRIDGVVHGAGVIEDKLVRDKELGSFERVLATKAGAARTLAAKLRPETLRFLAFFGSVSGRFGNRGQADYAAASEILNKLAHELDRRWAARVVSIDWGPWLTTGMVSPALQEEFERRGVILIPIDEGCRLFEQELRNGRKGEAEVVIGGLTSLSGEAPSVAAPRVADTAHPLLTVNTAVTRTADGGLVAERAFELDDDLYLNDHRIDGRPIVPFAVSMELLAETASAAHPGFEVAGLREVRVLGGITVDDSGYGVRATAAPAAADPGGFAVEASIAARDGGRAHYRALVDLRPEGSAVEAAVPAPFGELAPFTMTLADAYREFLFHGPLFQQIASIDGLDERGATALILPSDPAACIRGASGEWLLDPVVVDCAFQLQVIWARLQWGVTLLPGSIDRVTRVAGASAAAADGVRLELRVRPESKLPLCHADHYFFAPDGRLLVAMTNAQGIGSKALNRLASVGG